MHSKVIIEQIHDIIFTITILVNSFITFKPKTNELKTSRVQ